MKTPRALVDVISVRRQEVPFVVAMSLYFFVVIAIFWLLKPLKTAAFYNFYGQDGRFELFGAHFLAPEAELLAKVGNVVVAFLAMVVFSALSKHLRRERLTFAFAGLSALFMGWFALWLERPSELGVWAFYLFGDLFNTLMVATFFAFLSDSARSSAARRVYAPIVLGGVAGGAVGALGLRAFIDTLSLQGWLLLSVALLGIVCLLAWRAGRFAKDSIEGFNDEPILPDPPTDGNPALAGAKLVMRSRYLLAIVVMVALYEIVSSMVDYEFKATIHHYLAGDDLKRHLSTVYAATNVLGLLVQLFVTGLLMNRVGVRAALLVLPLLIGGLSLTFAALPLLWVGSTLSVVDNGLNYSVNQSARESLYTVVSTREKYQAKAFIDMFVQRLGKLFAVGVNLALAATFGTFGAVRWLSLVTIGVVIVWIAAANFAGSRFDARDRARASHAVAGDTRQRDAAR